jgi:AbrB family looped-hinge helix DNA binding protein
MVKMGPGKCYGTTSLGDRGQIVIPKEAREDLGLNKGDKLLVCGKHNKALILVKTDQLPNLIEELIKSLEQLKEGIKTDE